MSSLNCLNSIYCSVWDKKVECVLRGQGGRIKNYLAGQ